MLPGDTIYSIARLYGLTTAALLGVNPEVTDIDSIIVGQKLRIPDIRLTRPVIEVNGYAYPTVDAQVLENTLPYLTYLSIIGCHTQPDGTLHHVDDLPMIATAQLFRVASLMVISNIGEDGTYSGALAHTLLTDEQIRQSLLSNIISHLQDSGYYGVNIDFSELYVEDYVPYASFLYALTSQLHPLGYIVVVAPRINVLLEEQEQLSLINQRYSYNSMMDRLIIRTTIWTCAAQEAGRLSLIDELQRAVDFASSLISSNKILLTIPNCCYDWAIRDNQFEFHRFLSPAQADGLLIETGAKVQVDPQTQSSYFYYYNEDGMLHRVWCENETNLRGPLALVATYNLAGISFRTIDRFSMVSYQTLGSLYEIRKVI